MLAHFVRRRSLALVGALALVVSTGGPAAAAPGDPDFTFDGDGRVTTDFAGNGDEAGAVAIQGNGKIVAAGFADVAGRTDFAVARYHANGTLDTTFSGDGRVTTDFDGGFDEGRAVAIQADGKIVVAGFTSPIGNGDFAVARYNTDGSLDSTFDSDGRVTTDMTEGSDAVFAVAIQGDGKIVVAGTAATNFGLARYNPDGSLDFTFGGGRVTTDFNNNFDFALAVAIQGDGKIVAAGQADVPGGAHFALARYNTDGSLDSTFDGDGRVTTEHFAGGFNSARAVAIQGDGKIVAAGLADEPGNSDFALARYNTDGSLDSAFDSDGKLITDFDGSFDDGFAVAIQGDGKIVAAGRTSFTSLFGLVRYNANGSLDTGFSEDGKVVTDFAGGPDGAFAVAIQGDRKIVAAGFTGSGTASDFALARYAGDSCRRTSRKSSIPCP